MPSPENPQRRAKARGSRAQGASRGKDGKTLKRKKSAGTPMLLIAGIGGVATVVVAVCVFVAMMPKAKEPPAVAAAQPDAGAAKIAEPPAAGGMVAVPVVAEPKENVAKALPVVAPPAPPVGELERLEEWTFEKIPIATRERKMKSKEGSVLNVASKGISFNKEGKLIESADVSITKATLNTSEDQKLIIVTYENGYAQIRQRISATTPMYIGQLDSSKQPWNGLVFVTHANGVPRSRGNYTEGKRDGPFVCWDDNGHKRWEGTYAQGVLSDAKTFAAGDAIEDPTAILLSLGNPQAGVHAYPHDKLLQLMALEALLTQGPRALPVLSQVIKQLSSLAAPQPGSNQVDQLIEEAQALVVTGAYERLADVTAMARSLPALIWPMAEGTEDTSRSTLPASASINAGLEPL